MTDFLKARHFSPANRVALFVGTTHWLAGRKEDAHHDWLDELARQKSGSIIYSADAAGVILPALLYWSSIKLGDEATSKIALKEILRRSKIARYKINWAGPIGDFLLGKISESELLHQLESGYDEVDINRKCQSYFYIATAHLQNKDEESYVHNLQLCQQTQRIFMYEYHLAVHELSLHL